MFADFNKREFIQTAVGSTSLVVLGYLVMLGVLMLIGRGALV